MAWSGTFRLRFAPAYDPAAGCAAKAVLRVQASPSAASAYLSLPVAVAGNRGLTDDQPDDGQGGWTDQGENDLRTFVPGRHAFLGLPFSVGPRVAVLRGKERPALPLQTEPVPVNARLARLAFLHTCAWSAEFRQPVAEYLVTYEDGQTARVPVRYGVDVLDWWGAREPLSARLAWSGHNGSAPVGLFLMTWENPRPDAPVKTVQCVSLDSGAVPVWLARHGVVAKALTAQLALLDRVRRPRRGAVPRAGSHARSPGATGSPQARRSISALNHAGRPLRTLKISAVTSPGRTRRRRPMRFWGTNAASRAFRRGR